MQEDLHHLMLPIRQPVTDILGNATVESALPTYFN